MVDVAQANRQDRGDWLTGALRELAARAVRNVTYPQQGRPFVRRRNEGAS